jgi:hypothetical protein
MRVLGVEDIAVNQGGFQPRGKGFGHIDPVLAAEGVPAGEDQALQQEHTLAVFGLVAGLPADCDGVHVADGHVEDGFDGVGVPHQYGAAIVDEDVKGFEGVAESVLVLRVEEFGDDFKHK